MYNTIGLVVTHICVADDYSYYTHIAPLASLLANNHGQFKPQIVSPMASLFNFDADIFAKHDGRLSVHITAQTILSLSLHSNTSREPLIAALHLPRYITALIAHRCYPRRPRH